MGGEIVSGLYTRVDVVITFFALVVYIFGVPIFLKTKVWPVIDKLSSDIKYFNTKRIAKSSRWSVVVLVYAIGFILALFLAEPVIYTTVTKAAVGKKDIIATINLGEGETVEGDTVGTITVKRFFNDEQAKKRRAFIVVPSKEIEHEYKIYSASYEFAWGRVVKKIMLFTLSIMAVLSIIVLIILAIAWVLVPDEGEQENRGAE